MSLIDWFAARRKDQFVGKVSQDTDEGDGLWVKCSECSQVAYRKDLISNFNVCSITLLPANPIRALGSAKIKSPHIAKLAVTPPVVG